MTTKKAFVSGHNYIQDIHMEAGIYTVLMKVKSMYGDVCSFALFDGTTWTHYDMDTVQGQWKWAYVTFRILVPMTKINLISRNYSDALPVYVVEPQIVAGNVPVEAGASPFDIDKILNDVQADANTSLAKTKFMTEIDGGLIYSAMMKLYDAGGTGDEMAGISGIAGDDKEDPAFWAGGTYEQAIGGTAKAIIRHDGTSKFTDTDITGKINALGGTIGDLAVEQSGRIAMYIPNTTQSRLTFRATDIPALQSLLNTTVYGGDFTAGAGELAIPPTGTSTQTLIGSTYISQTGSTIEITGGRLLNLTCDFQGIGNASVGATLYLMRGSVKVQTLASAFVMGSGIQNDVGVVQSFTLEGMPSGTYTLMLEVSKVGTQLTSGNATVGSGVKVEWSFNREGVRNFLFGLNGFLSFFSNNHIYFTETTGLDVRGKTNMPGLLGSASVIGGQLSNEWGRITSIATYTGGYRVTISGMSHDKYTVQITSHTTNQWRIGTKTSSNFIILGTGDCDIAIMGNNY